MRWQDCYPTFIGDFRRIFAGGPLVAVAGSAFLPELDAAIDGVAVGSEDDVAGKILHQLGVAAAEENGVADQRRPEAFDDVENRFSPAFFAATFEACEADVVLVGAALFCRGDGRVRGG